MAIKKNKTPESEIGTTESSLFDYEPAECFDKVKTRGRPKLVLNAVGLRVIEALGAVMATEEEVAAALNVSIEALHSKDNEAAFTECYKKGRENGKLSLRHSQFQLAKVNATMAIFLGKQYLGQKDNPEETDTNEKVNVQILFGDTSKREGE